MSADKPATDAAEVARPSEQAQRVVDYWRADMGPCDHEPGLRGTECDICLAIQIEAYAERRHVARSLKSENKLLGLAESYSDGSLDGALPATVGWGNGRASAFREAADLLKREREGRRGIKLPSLPGDPVDGDSYG